MAADESHRYAAFISYSRHADAQVAPALEDGLERFAKPWNRLRALRVFRDDADLSASPGLWSSITAALDDAEYFILLASGEAAESTWVAREIEYWRSHRDVSRVLLVLTEGELAWDEAAGDFDWGRSTAVPEALRGAFTEEPRYTDLRWARNGDGLTLEDDRFQEAVADLAGTLHGRPKDEMIGEQVRQHRRTIRLARGAVAVLSVLALAATVAAVLAVRASKRAEAEARTALSRQLAAESGVAVRDGQLDSALLLAAQAPKERDTFEARSALAAALVASSHLDGIVRETPIERAAMSPDGQALAVVRRNGPVVVRDVRGRRVLGTVPLTDRPSLLALSSGGRKLAIAVVTSSQFKEFDATNPEAVKLLSSWIDVWDVEAKRWDPAFGGRKTSAFGPEFGSLSVSHDGSVVAATSGRYGVSRIDVWTKDRTDTLNPSSFPCRVILNDDGSLLAAITLRGVVEAEGVDVSVWRLAPGGPPNPEPQAVIALPRAIAPDGPSGCASPGIAAFSPAQSNVLAIGGRDGFVSVWDAPAGRRVGTPLRGRFGAVSQVAFSPDGSRLLARDDGGISIWDLDRREQVEGNLAESAADEGAWFVDRDTVVTVGSAGTIATSDLAAWPYKLAVPVSGGVNAAFSPDGSALAVEDGTGTIQFLDVASWKPKGDPIRTGFEAPSFAFSNDGRQLIAQGVVTGGQVRQIWDVDRRRPVGEPVEGDVGMAAFSVDDEPVVIETGIDEATIKSLRSGKRIAHLAGTQDAEDVEFHRQAGQALVETLWGSGIWDARSGKRLSRVFPSTSAAWTPDGTVVATGGDSIELWDAKTGRRLGSLPSETGGRDLRFSPDGTLLVAVGDGLEVWEVSRRSRLGGRRLGELGLAKVEFSPDGRAVATLDDEGQLLVWTLDGRKWASLACRLADRTLTRTEWDELVGNADFAPAC